MGSTAITCCDGGDPAVWFTHSQLSLFASQQPNGREREGESGSLCQGCRQKDEAAPARMRGFFRPPPNPRAHEGENAGAGLNYIIIMANNGA